MRDNNLQIGGSNNNQKIDNSVKNSKTTLWDKFFLPLVVAIAAGLILFYIFGI